MKKNVVLIIGIVVLCFSGLGYVGNFVQWLDAEETTAKVVSAEKQWVRRGSGNVNLDIEYYANGVLCKGTVSVSASQFEEGGANNEIAVYYMRKKPGRVIPVAVLKGKQRDIHIICAVGSLLTVAGVVLGMVKKRSSS